MHNENWDDLRFILAVAAAGSLHAAAKRLSVNHATVLRRVAAFEERAGTRLFDRTPQGYRLREDAKPLLSAAGDVEKAFLAVGRALSGQQSSLVGPVRLTTTDTFAIQLLPPILTEFSRLHPEIKIEMNSANSHLDLGRMEADLTVRPALALPKDLDGLPAGQMSFSLYDTAENAAHRDRRWIAATPLLARSEPARWLAQNVADEEIATRADSFVVMAAMAAAGLGRALLPDCLGQLHSSLTCLSPTPILYVSTWVASHPDLSDVGRISVLKTYLATALTEAQSRHHR